MAELVDVLLTGNRDNVGWLILVPVATLGGGASRERAQLTSSGFGSFAVSFNVAVAVATSRLGNVVVICACTGSVAVMVLLWGTGKSVPEEADADAVGPAGPV